MWSVIVVLFMNLAITMHGMVCSIRSVARGKGTRQENRRSIQEKVVRHRYRLVFRFYSFGKNFQNFWYVVCLVRNVVNSILIYRGSSLVGGGN